MVRPQIEASQNHGKKTYRHSKMRKQTHYESVLEKIYFLETQVSE